MAEHRYRRSQGLVTYWSGAHPICFIWQTASRVPVSPEIVGLLHSLADWTTATELRGRIASKEDVGSVEELLQLLFSLRLIEREVEGSIDAEWVQWTPEAAFFHFGTKNGSFPEDLTQRDRELVKKAVYEPQPPPTKHIAGQRNRLPAADLSAANLASALVNRRTWRRFSDVPVPASALGTLLDQTFGVRARGLVPGQGNVVLKTSPSGGCRHPIEAYLLAWNVDGVAPGVYHYDSDTNELVDLRRPISSRDIAGLLAHQTYFASAGAAVVMCPVFARTMWRYGHSRAYRTVLIEAGHLGQTFCLVATALGLAPFTTMAFSEAKLEELLQVDGITECPIYVTGVGMPSANVENPGRWLPSDTNRPG